MQSVGDLAQIFIRNGHSGPFGFTPTDQNARRVVGDPPFILLILHTYPVHPRGRGGLQASRSTVPSGVGELLNFSSERTIGMHPPGGSVC